MEDQIALLSFLLICTNYFEIVWKKLINMLFW